MELTINGEQHKLDAAELTVAALLVELQIEQKRGIAVARNREVVPRSRWETEFVTQDDEIEIVRATQGG